MSDKNADKFDIGAEEVFGKNAITDAMTDQIDNIAAFGRACAEEARAEAFREAAEIIKPYGDGIRVGWLMDKASGTKP